MKRFIYSWLLPFTICIVLTGCNAKDNGPDATQAVSTTEDSANQKDASMDIISADEFLAYYNLQSDDVKDYDLQGMINDYEITAQDLASRDWYKKLVNDAELGITYGKNLSRMILDNCRTMTQADDITQARYLAYELTIPVSDGENLCYSQRVAIDLEEKKIYYNCDFNNIYDCEKTWDIDDEQLSSIFSTINDMELSSWENNLAYSQKETNYLWDLYLIMNKTDVIRYMGTIPATNTKKEALFEDIKTLIDECCR